MLTGDMAKYQIEDRIREAEHARFARPARADRTSRVAVVEWLSGLLAAVVGRRRKATPTSAPVQAPLA